MLRKRFLIHPWVSSTNDESQSLGCEDISAWRNDHSGENQALMQDFTTYTTTETQQYVMHTNFNLDLDFVSLPFY